MRYLAHEQPRIDAHILLGAEPLAWRIAALGDIHALARQTPLHLHPMSALPGRFGAARKSGWRCGDAPYLTWFDPDDRYPPAQAATFLQAASTALDAVRSLAAVFSLEQQITASGRLIGTPSTEIPNMATIRSRPVALHGLQLWRRSVVQSIAPSLQDTDPIADWHLLLSALDAGHAWLRLAPTARHWRRYAGQTSAYVKIASTRKEANGG